MRLLKIVILALVLLAIALFGASYQLPLQIEVEQSVVLEVKPEQVYPLLENPMEWEKWSMINTSADPTMIRLYGGPIVGTGARMKWSGDKVGTGEVIFMESIKPTRLLYKQNDSDLAATTNGSFTLERMEGGLTKVLWKQSVPVKDEPVARLIGVWKKHKKQDELDKGLLRLKTLLQNNASKGAAKKRTATA